MSESRYHAGETVPMSGGGLGYNGRTTKDALSQRELTQGYDHFQLRNQ